jgi:hypothetical protein
MHANARSTPDVSNMKPVHLILFIVVFLKVFLRTADEKKCFKILITAQQLQALGQLGC